MRCRRFEGAATMNTRGVHRSHHANLLAARLHTIAALTLLVAACDDLPPPSDDELPIPPPGVLVPTQVSGTLPFTTVSTGAHHTCALQTTGAVWCWGSNQYAQLGTDAAMERCHDSQFSCSGAPLRVSTSQAMVAVAAGFRHTC